MVKDEQKFFVLSKDILFGLNLYHLYCWWYLSTSIIYVDVE